MIYLSSYFQFPIYLASVLVTVSFIKLRWKSNAVRLPPSPPGEPFLGHARRMPLQYSWETFFAWKETLGEIVYYANVSSVNTNTFCIQGDIFYLDLLGRPMIVINSIEIARELLDSKGATFSDRPHSYMMNGLYVVSVTFRVSLRT